MYGRRGRKDLGRGGRLPVARYHAAPVMRHLAAICFDLDDTLWAVGPVLQRAEQAMYAWLADRCPRVTERHDLKSMQAVRERVVAEHPERRHDLTFLRRQALLTMVTEAGYAQERAEKAFSVFFAVRNDVKVFDDVRPALERLRLRYRLLALTNGNADLVAIGLDGFFETCLSARDAGVAKPDRRIFAALLQRVRLAPGQVAYVGDDPVVDVEGARRAGLDAVWVNRFARPWPMDLEPPAHRVRNLGELAGLLL